MQWISEVLLTFSGGIQGATSDTGDSSDGRDEHNGTHTLSSFQERVSQLATMVGRLQIGGHDECEIVCGIVHRWLPDIRTHIVHLHINRSSTNSVAMTERYHNDRLCFAIVLEKEWGERYEDVERVAEMGAHGAEEILPGLAHGQVTDGAGDLEAGLAPRLQAGLERVLGPGAGVDGCTQACQFLHDGPPVCAHN